eukprot:7788037-Ditylum_brightwellii.AAC.1
MEDSIMEDYSDEENSESGGSNKDDAHDIADDNFMNGEEDTAFSSINMDNGGENFALKKRHSSVQSAASSEASPMDNKKLVDVLLSD